MNKQTYIESRAVRSTFAAPVPTYCTGHPCFGQPLLDEDGEQLRDRRGRPRVIRVGDYIHSAKPEEFFTDVVEPLVRARTSSCSHGGAGRGGTRSETGCRSSRTWL